MTEEIVMLLDPEPAPEVALAAAWKRHRIRRLDGREGARLGYFEILVAAAPVIVIEEREGRDPLPALLLASGAVS